MDRIGERLEHECAGCVVDAEEGQLAVLRQNLWNLSGGVLGQLICGEVRSNMTQAQWTAAAPGQPYQKTCPAYP